jgi:oligosaccharyltransferase complex subunit beta
VTEDVHMELTMLDPYYHVAMEHGSNGHYSVSLRLPDVPGVFQYKLHLTEPGITTVLEAKKVVVRPYRHDEHERFIFAAYPYYISAISMMVGGYLFGVVYLYHK